MVGRPPDRRPYPLAFVNGGLNLRAGQVALERNQTKQAKNISLLLEGGFTKTPGFTEIADLQTPIKGMHFYEGDNNEAELIAYHTPYISRVDTKRGISSFIDNSATGKPYIIENDGSPQFEKEVYKTGTTKTNRMHIVDGANANSYFTGDQITAVSWPPSYSATNATQLASVYATGTNYTAKGFPYDVCFYQNRMFFITKEDIGIIFFSKAGNGVDLNDNAGAPVPRDIAGYLNCPASTPFTAIESTPNGIMVYELNGTSRIVGINVPISGLSDQFEYQKMNSTIGALSPNLAVKLTDNEHLVLHTTGLYNIKLSQNFSEVKPGEVSYYIQPAFDGLGRKQLQKGKMLVAPHIGACLLTLPRKSTHLWNDKLYKYFYGVGSNSKPKTIPWMIDEFFGGAPTRFDAIALNPKTNEIYFAVYNKIYKWDGPSFLPDNNGAVTPIQSEYEFPPLDFDLNGIDKYISAYYINYKSSTGGIFYLDHAWDNGDDGRTRIDFTASDSTNFPITFGSSTWSSRSSFEDVGIRVPVSGGQIGKQLVVTFLHNSSTEDITIYDIGVEYEIL